jgi:ABC-type multidrug transport system fused ATPase/permease subunit
MKYGTPPKNFGFFDLLRAIAFLLDTYKYKALFWAAILFLVRFYILLPPVIVGKIVDFFTGYKPGQPLTPFFILAAIFGLAHITAAFFRLTAKTALINMEAELTYNAKVKGFEQLLDFSIKWHDKENTGNKVQRIQNGIFAIREFRKLVNNDGLQAPAAIIGILIMFLFIQPIFVVFLSVYIVLFMAIQIHFYKKLRAMLDQFNASQEKASGVYYEGLNNVVTLKTLGAKDSFKTNIYNTEQVTKDFTYKRYRLNYRKSVFLHFVNAASIIIYFLMVGHGVLTHAITVGAIVIFYSYINNLSDTVWQTVDLFDDVVEVRSAVARMMPIYWEDTGLRVGTKDFPTNWAKIAIKDGNFHYTQAETEDEVFKIDNLNFEINKGEKIGIVGHSGSGKSTLAKLLLGMYDLESGGFTIGNSNYYDIKHTDITHHIAIVLQESEMFNLSLRENITLMKTQPPQFLQKAVEIAQLEGLFKRLPQGLDTLIGEKGYRLSGGERQRIGIARAIYKDPEVFVFDEATSSLDSKTENLIQEALENELQKKTMIIIAHRISTLKNVDRIYVFDHGKVVEEGRYRSLINQPDSLFFKIYQRSLHQQDHSTPEVNTTPGVV